MVKKETLAKATKVTLATGVLLSAVAPYSVQAAATYTTAAELTKAINALNPKVADNEFYTAAVDAIQASYEKFNSSEKGKLSRATTIQYNNHVNAVAVIKEIKTVLETDVETLTATTIGAAKTAIADAKAEHKKLSTTARSYVTNYAALTAYEAAVTKQEKYLNNLVAMDGFLQALNKIVKTINLEGITAKDFENLSADQKYTDDELTAITTARAEYAKLTSAVKQSVLPADLKKLTDAEQQAKYQAALTLEVNKNKVAKFTNLVTALNTSADDYETQVDDVVTAYGSLEESVKSALSRATMIMYNNHKDAKVVVDEITAATKLEDIEAADQAALDAIAAKLETARTNYLALSTTARSYVKNYTDLTKFEAAVKARQAALNNADALSAWDSAYEKIAALPIHDFTGKTAADYLSMDKYDDTTELPLIEAASAEYAKLTATLKSYVGAAKVEKLVALEKAAADQAVLKAAYDKETGEEAAIVAELGKWQSAVTELPTDEANFDGLPGNPGEEPHDTAFDTAKYQDDVIKNILAARVAYTALSAAAKDRVTFDDYKKLTDHEAALSEQNVIQANISAAKAQVNQDAATVFEGTVKDLKGWTVAADYKVAVDGVNTAYGTLAADVQTLVSTTIMTELENHTAAALVVVLVDTASEVTAIEAVDATAAAAQTELDGLKTSVTTARSAYDALKAAQKGFVKNVTDLTAKETAINKKQAEINQEVQLKPFKDAMATLGDVVHTYDDVTFKSEITVIKKYADSTVEAARTAYNNLTPALQAKVTDLYTTLEKHEAAYETQKDLVVEATAYQAVKAAVEAVETNITALGDNVLTIPELKDYVPEGDGATVLYTEIQQGEIETAQEGFEALLTDGQKFVNEDLASKLADFHASLQKQIQLLAAYKDGEIAKLKAQINGWSITTGTDLAPFILEVADAKTAYETFLPADFTAAETTKLNNYVAAMPVVDQILKLEDTYKDVTASANMDTYIQAAAAAREAFKDLPSAQKLLVVNISVLSAYEKAVAAKQHELLVDENLADWNLAYLNIKDIAVLTIEEEGFDYTEFTYYEPEELGFITAAQTAYDAIAPEYRASVDATEHQKLTDLQASISKYNELKAAQNQAEQELEAALQPFKDALDALTPATPHDYTDKTVDNYKDAGVYSPEDESKIKAAQAAFEAIEEPFASKVEQTDKDKLQSYVASLTTFKNFETEAANKDAIAAAMEPWTTALTAIQAITPKGYATTITKDNVGTQDFEEHDPATKTAVDTARKAHDALAENEEFKDLQSRIPADDLKVLTDLEAEITAYNTANAAKINAEKAAKKAELLAAIKALDVEAATYKQEVEAAKLLYMAMTPEVKAEFQAESATEYAAFVNHQAVATVIDLVTAVGTVADIEATKTTTELEPIQNKIVAARTAYKALTAAQKALYADTALVALEEAAAAQATALQNADKIAAWITGYGALPALVELENVTATTYNTTERQAITGLREVFKGYDAQTQALVNTDELQKLVALEAALQQQDLKIAEAEQLPKLAAFKAALAAITFEVIDFTNITLANFETSPKYTEPQLALIEAAKAEFTKLEEASKPYLTKEEQDKYNALVAGATKQNELQIAFDAGVAEEEEAAKLAEFVTALTNLDPAAVTYTEDVKKVEEQYTALTDELRAKLTRAQNIIYTNHTKAAEVVELITTATASELLEAATTVEALTDLEKEVNAAKTAYTALSTTARSYVKNYNAVATTLAAITAKKQTIQNADAIQDWTAGYGNLPALLDFANVSYETINDAITYTPGEITAVENLRSVYNGYTATVKGYVAKEEVAQLVAIEKAIARQTELQEQAGNAATITEKLADWTAAFAKLPENVIDMEGITVGNIADYAYAEGTEENVKAARAAYTAIEAAYKTFVTPAELQKLVDLEQSLVIYNKVNGEVLAGQAETDAAPVIEAFTKLKLGSNAFVEDAIQLKADFDKLSDAAKAEITRANQITINNYGSAAQVMKDIEALPKVDAIKATTEKAAFETIQTAVNDARTAFTSLSTTARSYVSNYADLTAAEAAVKAQAIVIANQELLVTWNEAVAALPEFVDISNMTTGTYAETYNADAKVNITTARAEYAKLSTIVKSTVNAADVALLVNLENAVKHQTALESKIDVEKAAAFVEILNALDPSAEDYVATVNAMEQEYTTLPEPVKAKLTFANNIMMNNHLAAAKVVTAINDIALAGETEEQIAAYKAQITEARAAYAGLSSTARSYVKNYSILTGHEAEAKLLP